MRIILAGIGMGAREQMTQAVQEACMNADIIFGAAKSTGDSGVVCDTQKKPFMRQRRSMHIYRNIFGIAVL